MKRIYKNILAFSALSFLSVQNAFAQIDANINPGADAPVINPATSIGGIVSLIVSFIVVIGTLAALLYIIIGALQWITSGGDKTKVESARNHIIAAIIGLLVIALSLVIINMVMQVLGLGSLTEFKIPTIEQFT